MKVIQTLFLSNRSKQIKQVYWIISLLRPVGVPRPEITLADVHDEEAATADSWPLPT